LEERFGRVERLSYYRTVEKFADFAESPLKGVFWRRKKERAPYNRRTDARNVGGASKF